MMGEQSRHNEISSGGRDSMQISTEKMFNLLLDVRESVSRLTTQMKELDEKVDVLNNELPAVKNIAQDAKAQSDKLAEQVHSRTQYLLYVWIPIAAAIIPTLLPHIHFQ